MIFTTFVKVVLIQLIYLQMAQTAYQMKDIDRVNILDVLNLRIASNIMEKFSLEKPIFQGGDIIISPQY